MMLAGCVAVIVIGIAHQNWKLIPLSGTCIVYKINFHTALYACGFGPLTTHIERGGGRVLGFQIMETDDIVLCEQVLHLIMQGATGSSKLGPLDHDDWSRKETPWYRPGSTPYPQNTPTTIRNKVRKGTNLNKCSFQDFSRKPLATPAQVVRGSTWCCSTSISASARVQCESI
eukprot:2856692-Amphidinium_carterae.1